MVEMKVHFCMWNYRLNLIKNFLHSYICTNVWVGYRSGNKRPTVDMDGHPYRIHHQRPTISHLYSNRQILDHTAHCGNCLDIPKRSINHRCTFVLRQIHPNNRFDYHRIVWYPDKWFDCLLYQCMFDLDVYSLLLTWLVSMILSGYSFVHPNHLDNQQHHRT